MRTLRAPVRLAPLRVLACLAALAVAGCGSSYMHTAKGPQPPVPAGQAVVVFLRPSMFALLAHYQVIDEKGRFLGELLAGSHFAVPVPAGDHVFVAFHDGDPLAHNDAMRARLLPGLTYFALVQPTMTGVEITAIAPRSESWSRVRGWLADTDALVPDPAAGQAFLADHGDLLDELEAGYKHLSDDDAEELDEHTLLATDGVR